ncbi:MAG: nucleotidyltransferase domain-containing protein [Gemmatimonadota bacterium]|nr:nucleotidyltransferase domain-containing protein [Gemmatimonadota bacterium]
MSRTPAPGDDAARVLFGQTRRRVLGLLFARPDEALYLRQIVRLTGAAQGAVQRELQALTRAAILRRTVQGRQVYFQANSSAPIFPELRALLLKTVGAVEVLRDAMASVAERVRVAFVFGSAARGELRGNSDIDLLVVGDAPFAEIVGVLATAQERLGREVNPTIYPAAEFGARLRANHHFLTRVLAQPLLFVIGDVDELGRLGAERMADGAPDERGRDQRSARRCRARPRG